CPGAGVGDGAWHVGHAVVHHAVYEVGRGVVGGRPDGLDATALIHGHVHDDAALFHQRQHVAGDEARSPCSWDEHGTDEQVGPRQRLDDVTEVAGHGLHPALEHVV